MSGSYQPVGIVGIANPKILRIANGKGLRARLLYRMEVLNHKQYRDGDETEIRS